MGFTFGRSALLRLVCFVLPISLTGCSKEAVQVDPERTSFSSIFTGGTYSQTEYVAASDEVELNAAGKTAGTGTYTSPVFDAKRKVTWETISAVYDSPINKEMPNNGGTESIYATGNVDMSGNVLLLHMNEDSWSGTANEVIDSSGRANHGRRSGDAQITGDGKFNNGGSFDGNSDFVLVDDDDSLELAQFTIGGWFFFNTDIGIRRLINKGSQTTNDYSYRLVTLDAGLFGFDDGLVVQISADGTNQALQATCNTCLLNHKDKWVFLAITYNGTQLRLFINDSNVDFVNGVVVLYNGNGDLGIGADVDGTFGLNGKIDEVAFFNYAMTDDQLFNLYRRGAHRIKMQVRTCSNSTCNGSNFLGTNLSSSNYFEATNTNVEVYPTFDLNLFPASRYFQYQWTLESDSTSSSPGLKSVILNGVTN